MFSFRFSRLPLLSTTGYLMLQVFFQCFWFYSMCLSFSHPPFLASIQSDIDKSCEHSSLGIHLLPRTWQGVHLFWFTCQHLRSQHWTAILHICLNHWSYLPTTLQGAPWNAFSLTLCNPLLHFFSYSIALNFIFTAYAFSPIFPNCLSSIPQMEPTPSQVRNHYSQKNQESHLKRALAFKKEAHLHCPSNVYSKLSSNVYLAFRQWWPRSPMSLLKEDANTD